MLRLLSLVVLLAGAPGCFTVQSKVPGVLDLRSDGSEAPVDHSEIGKGAARGGFDSFAFGDGVTGGGDVLIEDRAHYLFGLLTIGNPSSTEEWRAALGGEQLRNVAITERIGGMSVLLWLGKTLCVPCVGSWLQGTWDFRARATRIQAVGNVREESITPPADPLLPPPPSDPAAPTSTQRF